MKKIIFLITLFLGYINGYSQFLQWQKCYGGSKTDKALTIQQTEDGGYILGGRSMSDDGDVPDNHGDADYWLVKTGPSGIVQWQKNYGGSGEDVLYSIKQLADGSYILAGFSKSINGDVTGLHGESDVWVIKTNTLGDIQWQKCYGGTWYDESYCINQTSDQGYIIAGLSNSKNGDLTNNHGGKDFWILKISPQGEIQWQKSMGGSEDEWAESVQQTSDGGYIVAGHTFSDDGDVSGKHGGFDVWVVKTDTQGNIQWQKCYGGSGADRAFSVRQTNDDGYIIAGHTYSDDADVSGNHGENDYWVIKTDPSGQIQWQKCFGGSNEDFGTTAFQTTDGGYIIGGYSESDDGDVTHNHGGSDYWIVKTDSAGQMKWKKNFGGSFSEQLQDGLQQTVDGSYIIAGTTLSNDFDVSGNHGKNFDYWMVKLCSNDSLGIEEKHVKLVSIYPNPTNDNLTLTVDAMLVGSDYTISNQQGETILRGKITAEISTINISELSAGAYIFKIGNQKKGVLKIIKK